MERATEAEAAAVKASFGLEQPPQTQTQTQTSTLRQIITVASVAVGLQFGWALQLSLLTPYAQLLGIPHKWATLIWLGSPISNMLLQPIVGFRSDNCTSRFGRRRPFIATAVILVTVACFLIGYAADLGHLFGDSVTETIKPRAIGIFVLGFWTLDVANNTLQGPCRALLADLSGNSQEKTRTANSLFSFFMAVGSVLGYAAGSHTHLYHLLPFTKSKACDVYCANLKTCFFLSVALLLTLTIISLTDVREKPWSPELVNAGADDQIENSGGNKTGSSLKIPIFGEIFGALKSLQRPMLVLLLVTALNWIAWFPFLLFDTDWMGREVYGGTSKGNADEIRVYDNGVRAGALGLMLNAVVAGIASLSVEFLARAVGGVKRLWGIVNFLLAICLTMTVLITKLAESNRQYVTLAGRATMILPPAVGIKAGALAVFAAMGIPLAVTCSVPFALTSIFSRSSKAGQGLSLGVLNLAIVIPQIIVSLVGGPFDAAFGGGNMPAFIAGAIAAAASGIVALTMLPSPSPDNIPEAKTAFGASGSH